MKLYLTPVKPCASGFGMYEAENHNRMEITDCEYQPFQNLDHYRDWLESGDYDVEIATDLDGKIQGQNGRTCYRITNEAGDETLELWEEGK